MGVEFDERLSYMLLGCAIGFVLGYVVRVLSEIKKKVDHVDESVTHVLEDQTHVRDEQGLVRKPLLLNVVLFGVVVMTAYAAIQSGKVSNDVQDTQAALIEANHQVQNTQDALARVTSCNQQFLAKALIALNETTTYTQARADKNVELQKSQARFLSVVLSDPPVPEAGRRQALSNYFDKLTEYVQVSAKSREKVRNNPYPTNAELGDCLNTSSN